MVGLRAGASVKVLIDNSDAILRGIYLTIELVVGSFICAALLGLLIAVCRISPLASLRGAAAAYVEILRSIPITVIMVFMYFALPELGIVLSGFVAAVVALSMYHAAYIVEVIRSGVNGVPVGQVEAARALGFSYGRILRSVVLPQSIRGMVLPLGNVFIDLLKRTSVAYTIAVIEITGTATNLAARFAEPVPVFVSAATAYLLLTVPLGVLFRRLDHRVAFKR